MSYHIVSIDAPNCSLSCRDGQLTCRTDEGERRLPLEDVAAIIITSFSASIHSHLLLEAAKQGVALIVCEAFKPVSLVLPANRSTDTLLSRAVLDLEPRVREALWRRTVDAKCQNQAALATCIAPQDGSLADVRRVAGSRSDHKESTCARLFWGVFGRALGQAGFRREPGEPSGVNALLNYGYAVLLSTVLQKLFAVGLDPTWGLSHVARERATPLAYDLMEPFRPCVAWRVWQWTRQHPDPAEWQVSKPYRGWVTGFVLERVEHLEFTLEIRGVIEGVIRSFRRAVMENAVRPYHPWQPEPGEWPPNSGPLAEQPIGADVRRPQPETNQSLSRNRSAGFQPAPSPPAEPPAPGRLETGAPTDSWPHGQVSDRGILLTSAPTGLKEAPGGPGSL